MAQPRFCHILRSVARPMQRGGHVERVGTHQDDVGGLDRHVGAGADRDAEVGPRQRRGVVDPVADHRHPAPGALQLGDLRRLVLRQYLRDDGVDAELSGDPFGGGAVVAGEHDDLDIQLVQRIDRGRGGGPGRIRDGQHPGQSRTQPASSATEVRCGS